MRLLPTSNNHLKKVQFLIQIFKNSSKKKRAQKKQLRAQGEIENSNILDFIYSNLPPDLAETRNQAQRQTEEAERMREQAKALSESERERKRQEKKLAREAAKAEATTTREGKYKKNQRDIQNEADDEKTKKTKTKSVKTVDEDGFVTLDTQYIQLNEEGVHVATVTASNKKKDDDKENDKKKKSNVPPTSPALENNPFAQIKHSGGVQTAQELQAKMNAKKGEQKNLENNELQKDRKKPAPPVVPPSPKAKKEKKPKKEAEIPDEIAQKSHHFTVATNPQPYILVAFGVALAVLAYVFILH